MGFVVMNMYISGMKMVKILIIGVMGVIVMGCNGDKTAAGRYAGHNVSSRAEIIKDGKAKTTTIETDIDGPWQLYAGITTDKIDFSRTVAKGDAAGRSEVDVTFMPRRYFQLITNDGKAIFAERRLPMEGGYNYRDMGGYRTANGRYVKWGLVFRTDDMHNLTQPDLDYLSSIPLRTVVDFRSEQEIAQGEDRLPASVTNHTTLSISPGNISDMSQMQSIDAAKMEEFMIGINRSFSDDPEVIAKYRDFFRLLQQPENLPLSFHCTAGKDRTGMAAALFLYSLGVPEDVIMQDYLLSNKYLTDKYSAIMEQYPAIRPALVVDKRYLQAGIDQIKTNFGSVEKFLTEQLEVDIPKMKKIYLYR